jgi:hypothetical protein
VAEHNSQGAVIALGCEHPRRLAAAVTLVYVTPVLHKSQRAIFMSLKCRRVQRRPAIFVLFVHRHALVCQQRQDGFDKVAPCGFHERRPSAVVCGIRIGVCR